MTPLEDLSVDQVKRLVSANTLSVFKDLIAREAIDGKKFAKLTAEDLTAHDVGKIIQRKSLLRLISKCAASGVEDSVIAAGA